MIRNKMKALSIFLKIMLVVTILLNIFDVYTFVTNSNIKSKGTVTATITKAGAVEYKITSNTNKNINDNINNTDSENFLKLSSNTNDLTFLRIRHRSSRRRSKSSKRYNARVYQPLELECEYKGKKYTGSINFLIAKNTYTSKDTAENFVNSKIGQSYNVGDKVKVYFDGKGFRNVKDVEDSANIVNLISIAIWDVFFAIILLTSKKRRASIDIGD